MRAWLVALRRWVRGWFPLVELEFDSPQWDVTVYLPGTRVPVVALREYEDGNRE